MIMPVDQLEQIVVAENSRSIEWLMELYRDALEISPL